MIRYENVDKNIKKHTFLCDETLLQSHGFWRRCDEEGCK